MPHPVFHSAFLSHFSKNIIRFDNWTKRLTMLCYRNLEYAYSWLLIGCDMSSRPHLVWEFVIVSRIRCVNCHGYLECHHPWAFFYTTLLTHLRLSCRGFVCPSWFLAGFLLAVLQCFIGVGGANLYQKYVSMFTCLKLPGAVLSLWNCSCFVSRFCTHWFTNTYLFYSGNASIIATLNHRIKCKG